MLVLTRKPNQVLLLRVDNSTPRGDLEIRVKVLDIMGRRVAIGIEAPQNVHIIREEIA